MAFTEIFWLYIYHIFFNVYINKDTELQNSTICVHLSINFDFICKYLASKYKNYRNFSRRLKCVLL